MIGKLARSQAPVYITGESGSGKELAARLIHQRRAARRAAVRRGQLRRDPREPDGERVLRLPEGRLHRRRRRQDGFFQAAEGGTLFLDEVADLPLPMQVKLLRVIQEKKVRPVGPTAGGADRRAHHQRHPPEPVGAGRGGRVPPGPLLPPQRDRAAMPSLREIPEDIPVLVQRDAASASRGRPAPRAEIADEAMMALQHTPSRATCASWRTSSSARWRCAATPPSPPTTSTSPRGADKSAVADGARHGVAAARLPRPGRARGDHQGPGEDPLQQDRRRQAARHHLPLAALPPRPAGDQVAALKTGPLRRTMAPLLAAALSDRLRGSATGGHAGARGVDQAEASGSRRHRGKRPRRRLAAMVLARHALRRTWPVAHDDRRKAGLAPGTCPTYFAAKQ